MRHLDGGHLAGRRPARRSGSGQPGEVGLVGPTLTLLVQDARHPEPAVLDRRRAGQRLLARSGTASTSSGRKTLVSGSGCDVGGTSSPATSRDLGDRVQDHVELAGAAGRGARRRRSIRASAARCATSSRVIDAGSADMPGILGEQRVRAPCRAVSALRRPSQAAEARRPDARPGLGASVAASACSCSHAVAASAGIGRATSQPCAVVAAQVLQLRPDLRGLDALGDGLQPERVREVDDRAHDRGVLAVARRAC